MVPVVRIGDNNWERLKQWAVPLEDTPDDTLGKLLDIADAHSTCSVWLVANEPNLNIQPNSGSSTVRPPITDDGVSIDSHANQKTRLPKGVKVPNEAYELPILEAVYELGGSARMGEVLKLVEKKMQHLLGDVEYQTQPSGADLRWRNTAQWARNTLVHQRGMLKKDSSHGVWELTDKGMAEVERQKK